MALVIQGDCIARMRQWLPDDSIDAIVTDPPYGLGFMGRVWDKLPPGEEWARECLRVLKPGGHMLAFGGTRTWHRLAVAIEDAGFEIRDSIAWLYSQGFPKGKGQLKPSHEPIVVARKGGAVKTLNTNACRLVRKPGDRTEYGRSNTLPNANTTVSLGKFAVNTPYVPDPAGRWPANVVTDETQALAMGMSAKYYYCAKATRAERPVANGVKHETIKPLALMRWLIRLAVPPGGTVLDPFAGSGTTVEAAILEGFNVIGIEREKEYLPLIQVRIDRSPVAA